ncbi:hypothetical protein [Acaryochloris marina]|uniref:Uncharacterized protein n=1 Tax=Acaryochloris marina (strain MBIC 11017) TaxID=329726 RepID=A8ZNP1_ACAM1|nr:hypothetical protein [Acaryochloris marina]ABW32627.1 hypothetical protein AM1_D0132 [Acaryochloris marina MBIC11017]
MTRSELMKTALQENPVMTQSEKSQLQRRAFWNAVGGAIFIALWIAAAIAILSASSSPSAAPPIVFFGILLILTIGIGSRAYPPLKRTYVIWQDIRNGQVQFDIGTVNPQMFAAGRNVQMVLVVDGNRTYSALDSVLRSIRNPDTQGDQTDERYCLRIAPRSRIVVNVVPVPEYV